jgi:hypothetical protein
MKKAVFLISLLLSFPFEAWTQVRKPNSIAELAVYAGPDREQLLYTGAKTEGKVVWYILLRAIRTRPSLASSKQNIRA